MTTVSAKLRTLSRHMENGTLYERHYAPLINEVADRLEAELQDVDLTDSLSSFIEWLLSDDRREGELVRMACEQISWTRAAVIERSTIEISPEF